MVNKEAIISWFQGLQDKICQGLEELDGGSFAEDVWERVEGGGGRSRVIEGKHIEKGGVMFSAVAGLMPEVIAKGLGLAPNKFIATGVSIVLHPRNPYVPIVHMNVRYFETDRGEWWFGGGIDATPHYIDRSQAKGFHSKLKLACDVLDEEAYPKYKQWADDYFYNTHRQETRGIGGIFFDRLNSSSGHKKEDCWDFVRAVGEAFLPAYEDLFRVGYIRDYGEAERRWQLIRRGRYVEFNLIYDRGTKFGLQTNGRIESILVSMPPDAKWVYNDQPKSGSPERETLDQLKKGIDWLAG